MFLLDHYAHPYWLPLNVIQRRTDTDHYHTFSFMEPTSFNVIIIIIIIIHQI